MRTSRVSAWRNTTSATSPATTQQAAAPEEDRVQLDEPGVLEDPAELRAPAVAVPAHLHRRGEVAPASAK